MKEIRKYYKIVKLKGEDMVIQRVIAIPIGSNSYPTVGTLPATSASKFLSRVRRLSLLVSPLDKVGFEDFL